MEGPIYVINGVTIESDVTFPEAKMKEDTEGSGIYHRVYKGDGAPNAQDIIDNTIWAPIDAFDSKVKKSKTYSINKAELQGKKYIMRETAHYTAGEDIPAYSYLWAAGKMYYTESAISTSRGLYSYLQMVEVNDEGEQIGVYSKPFISGSDSFIEILEEPNGIEDVNKSVDPDGVLEIYDLMGRKVSNPRPGSIYIMNGIKVLFK